jgi:hypothetical protein
MSPAQNARDAKKVLGTVMGAGICQTRLYDTIEHGNIHAGQYWDRALLFCSRYECLKLAVRNQGQS